MSYVRPAVRLHFRDAEHEKFYHYIIHDLEGDEGYYTRLIVYLLGASPVTRTHFWDAYDGCTQCIRSGCWRESWNTPESRLVIALAAVLTCDIEAPAAASGTLVPCIVDAYQWSDTLYAAIEEVSCDLLGDELFDSLI